MNRRAAFGRISLAACALARRVSLAACALARRVSLAACALALGFVPVVVAHAATPKAKPAHAAATAKEPAAAADSGHYVKVNGIRMYYEVHGHGPALVLLHGGAGNGRQFDHQWPAFAKHFRVIVPDLCAQGRTTDRPGPLTYHAEALDVFGLMNQLGVKRFDVMGWSDGGVIGLDCAMTLPGRIRRLVTFGANFRADGLNAPDVAWNDTATVAAFGDDMRKGWQALSPEPAHYEAAMAKIIHLWKHEPDFSPHQLRAIVAKTMICAGEHDVVRPDHTVALQQAIPGSILWIVPNASHSAMIEKPDEVNAHVIAFLTKP